MRKKYGKMPEPFKGSAHVKGDAGVYRVLGIDWMNQTILIDRAGTEWASIQKVCLTQVEDN